MTAEPAKSTGGLGRMAGRGAATTIAGQVVRIVVQLTGIVILSRLLSPADYGLIASVVAIIGVGEVFRDFGLSSAAIQAKTLSREQKDNLFWINTLIGCVLSAIAFLCSSLIAGLYGDPRLAALTQVLSVTFLLNGLATQFRADLNRKLQFGALAGTEIGAQVAGLVIGIVMAMNGAGFWALAGQQVGQGIFSLLLLIPVTSWFPGRFHRGTETGHFIRFGSSLAATNLLGYASRNTDSIIIGATLGAGPLGLYNRAFQLLLLPLNQINAPATRVALPVLSRLHDDRPRYDAFLILGQKILLHVVSFILAFSCAQALPVIAIALGSKWLESAPLFQILSIAGFFQAAGYASYWVFLSKGLTRKQLNFALVTRPLLIGCVLVGALWGLYGVAIGYSIGVALMWPIGLWWIHRVSDAPVREMLMTGIRAIVGYGFATGVSWLSTRWLAIDAPWLDIAVGGASLCAALAFVALVWPSFRRDVFSIIKSREFFRAARKPRKSAPSPDLPTDIDSHENRELP